MATQDKNLIVLNEGQLEKAAATDTIQVYKLAVDAGVAITGDTSINGDLTVNGSIVSTSTTDVVISDQFLDLAFGNTTDTAKSGGFTVSHNRASSFTLETVTAFTAQDGAISPTFTVSGGSSAFAAGDIVAITGASDVDNNGLFVVASNVAGVVAIKMSPSASVPFVQNQFTTASAQTASAYKVDISAAAFADGSSAFKDSSGASWAKGTFVTAHAANAIEGNFTGNADWDSAAQTSLQEAYVNGNIITTSDDENVVIQGSEKLEVTATLGVSISNTLDLNGSMDADVSTYDVNASGAYTVVAGAASSVSTSAGDLTLDAQAASLILDGGEAAADAVRIVASNVGGGIDVDAGTAGIAVDSTGAISLAAAAASDFTVAGFDLTLETTGAGITDVKSAVEVQVSTALFDVNATGAVEVDAAGAISLDSTATASNFTLSANSGDAAILTIAATNEGLGGSEVVVNAGNDISVTSLNGAIILDASAASSFTATGDLSLISNAGSVNISASEAAVDAVRIDALDADGGIIVESGTGGFTLDTDGAISLDSTGTVSNFTLSADSGGPAILTIAATNSGIGDANLDIDAQGAITIDGASFSVDSTSASNMTVTGGNLTVSTVTSGVIAVSAAGNLDMDAAGTFTLDSSAGSISIGGNADAYGINIGTGAAARTITVGNTTGATALDVNLGTGGMTVDTQSGGAISLDAVGAASNFTVDGGNLTLSTATSGNLVLGSAGSVDMDAALGVTVDAGLGISLDAATSSNLTVTGEGESLTIGVVGGGAQQLSLGSAGTGANAVRVNAPAGGIDVDAGTAGITVDTTGSLSMQSANDSDLTMAANTATLKAITIEANNTGGGGTANVAVKAKSVIQLGDIATYTSAYIQAQHFFVFETGAGLEVEAGEALAIGDAVMPKWVGAPTNKVQYFKAANNAGTDVERNVHGVAQSVAGAAGVAFKMTSVTGVKVLTALTGLATSDVGKPLFLGTGGALTLTAPTSAATVFRAGFVSNHNGPGGKAVMMFQPQFIAKIL